MGYKVIENTKLAEGIHLIKIEAPHVVKNAKPGQFVIVVPSPGGERVPFTIHRVSDGLVWLVVQVVGTSSKKLSLKKPGQEVYSVLGPLGRPIEEKYYGKVLAVGGGVGIAPLFPKVEALKRSGNFIYTVLGYRSKKYMALHNELKELSDEILIYTDDGSFGRKGLVTHGVSEFISKYKFDLAIVVGPPAMMKAVCELTRPCKLKTLVSLNPIMVDGTGMCGSCRVKVGGEIKFACVDGPVFDGHYVDWDELMIRNSRFRDQERLSYSRFDDAGEDRSSKT